MNKKANNIEPFHRFAERMAAMRRKLTYFTLLAMICIFATASAVPEAYNGQVVVESKSVKSGDSFTIDIWLTGNDIEITSLRVPLKFDNQYLTCTYVDFSGSFKDPGMEGYYEVNGGELEVSYIPAVVHPLPMIMDDSGLIATLYFTVDNDAPDTDITIDSINQDTEFEQYATTFHLWKRVEVADDAGSATFIPGFVAGNIEVRRPTDVGEDTEDLLPESFALAQNYPNPFNPSTTIFFSLPEKANVTLEIFNLLGQKITTLADQEFPAGKHEMTWDASSAPSGIYFYRISAGAESITRKMLFLK